MIEKSVQPTCSDSSISDTKPAILHVLHSWGGGIDFFARDLQAGDKYRNHFFLKSHSRNNLPPYGKELCLYDGLENNPLATWYLSTPVMDTNVNSDEVVRILRSIIEKWAIGAVIVSSLIGHSLDVLKTGLPTALAIHDVYPFWPLLHDANNNDYSIEYLRQSLNESSAMSVFAQHEVEYWLAIRNELISVIFGNKIACISPSTFAKERVCRIDARLSDAAWSTISHGIHLPARLDQACHLKQADKLKVLVPGHINGGKGEVLLNQLIPQLPGGIELVLLGSAHLSNHFASEKVRTIDHYNRAELGDILADIKPDIALLASTVPETYGYVLSEMLQSGIPVICSNIGAYDERGKTLPGVTLVEPDVKSFLDALIMFRDNPGQLVLQKKNLPHIFPGVQEMANAWACALPTNAPIWLFEFTDDPSIENEVKMNLQLTHLAEILKSVHATTEKNTESNSEMLALLARQQSNIEGMLENISIQSQQLSALLARQNELSSSLLHKDKELEELKNAFQEQLLHSQIRDKTSNELIEKMQSDFDRKWTSFHEATSADKQAILAESENLKVTINQLDQKLSAMQSKRAWRFLRIFG
jgi:O-antigen biosynthesis protein